MFFFLFNDAESMVWTHHDIHVAEILLELALNTTQSINVVGKFCEFFNEKVEDYDHGVQESDCAVNSYARIFPYIFHIKPGFFRGVFVVVIVW